MYKPDFYVPMVVLAHQSLLDGTEPARLEDALNVLLDGAPQADWRPHKPCSEWDFGVAGHLTGADVISAARARMSDGGLAYGRALYNALKARLEAEQAST